MAFREVHGVIDLTEVTHLLQQLLQHSQQHDQQIGQLISEVQPMLQRLAVVEGRLDLVGRGLDDARQRLQQLHEACHISLQGQELTAREVASSNFHQVQALSRRLAKAVGRTEFEEHMRNVSRLDTSLRDLTRCHEQLALEVDQTRRTSLSLGDRLHALETVVGCKIDRSDFNQLESLVIRLEGFDGFVHGAQESLLSHAHRLRTVEETAVAGEEATRKMQDELTATFHRVNSLATKKDLQLLARELSRCDEELRRRLTLSEGLQMKSSLQQAHDLLQSLSFGVRSLVEEELPEVKRCLRSKADDAVLKRDYLPREDIEASLKAIDETLAHKTATVLTEQLREQVSALELRSIADGRRIDVAIQFVDWFAHRGENYEHNLQVIDRHLRGLLDSDKRTHRIRVLNPPTGEPVRELVTATRDWQL